MEKKEINYNFAKEFTSYPGPRYKDIGEHSGEEFREDILIPKFFDKNISIYIDVEDVELSFGPSFLSEAFGVTAKKYGLDKFNQIVKVKIDTEKGKRFQKKMMEYVEDELNGN